MHINGNVRHERTTFKCKRTNTTVVSCIFDMGKCCSIVRTICSLERHICDLVNVLSRLIDLLAKLYSKQLAKVKVAGTLRMVSC